MGGRGRYSDVGTRQLTIDDAQRQREVADIINEKTIQRAVMREGLGGGVGSPRLLKKCACYGEFTIPLGTEYEVCSICGWIDDAFQNRHPHSLDGRNPMSLLEARALFLANKSSVKMISKEQGVL